jgi:hypothetical protein
MANPVKYNTSAETLALKKGNFWIGTGDVGKGLEYYNGITPPTGGYTIYLNKASQGPSIYVPTNDAELISLTNRIAGAAYTTAKECLVYFAGQTDKMVFNVDYESIVTDGLVLNLDAGFVSSYPATGSTWYDLGSNGYNGTLTNGPTFNSNWNGSIVFDGTDDYVITSNTTYNFSTNANFTYCAWIYPGFSSTSNTGRAVIDFTGPGPGFLRSYLRWEGFSSTLGFYFDIAAGGGSAWYTIVIPTFSANTWHHLCFVHDSSNTGTFYFDGAAVSTLRGVANAVTVTNNKITIGYGAVNSYYWAGRISNVQIYNKALTASEISQNYNAQKGRYGDADYLAFYSRVIAAGGSLTETEQIATNQLVLDLKANGIWTAMKAIYPMVGASAAACAQNLKSSSFTGSFSSGWTFASTGVKPNGSAFMNTGLAPSANISQNSVSISYYSRTNRVATNEFDMGVENDGQSVIFMSIYYAGDSYGRINAFVDVGATSSSNTQAFYQVIRNNGTQYNWFRNTSKSVASQNSGAPLATSAIYIGKVNGHGAGVSSQKECAFSSIGDGLTDTQATNFYTAVQAFNTTLSRQV